MMILRHASGMCTVEQSVVGMEDMNSSTTIWNAIKKMTGAQAEAFEKAGTMSQTINSGGNFDDPECSN